MAEPFKNLINAGTVQAAGQHLRRVWPAFDRARFERLAGTGLEALEFKARADHLCAALEATLPTNFEQAAEVLEASLAPVQSGEDLGALRTTDAGLAGWVVWPMGEFVARRGRMDVPRSLQALHAMTQRFSAEFAIRPFIEAAPDAVFPTLTRWTRDPSPHVRRLVSEGSRPRLPWGLRLRALVDDPSPTLPLLRTLQDDPSDYVRRSVANHLNDIAKDHPDVVAQWLAEHLPDAPKERRALLRHASRMLIKQGHAPTLAHWGLGETFVGEVQWATTPVQARVGETVRLEARLHSTAPTPQTLEVDYDVHRVLAHGGTAPKVFKGWRLTLAAGDTVVLSKAHSLRPVTTRRDHPGEHRVDLRINGQAVAQTAFVLLP